MNLHERKKKTKTHRAMLYLSIYLYMLLDIIIALNNENIFSIRFVEALLLFLQLDFERYICDSRLLIIVARNACCLSLVVGKNPAADCFLCIL
jgi:hypothetical protein